MTSNELAHLADAEVLPAMKPALDRLQSDGMAKLREHAEMQTMAMQYGEFITQTGACPEIYRGKPLDAAAAILRGVQLGFTPDGALEAFFVIRGKVGMYARAMIAVAENIGCTVWEESASDESVTWCGTRPGDDKVESVTWTIERAKKAGYTSNAKYASNPQEMLRSKCQTELARIIAPGALMGMVSEVENSAQPINGTVEQVRPPKRGVAGLKAALAPAPAPEPVAEEPREQKASREQQQRIAELLDASGVKTKAAKLEYLQAQFGNHIRSAADITADQSAALIQFLEQPEDPSTGGAE